MLIPFPVKKDIISNFDDISVLIKSCFNESTDAFPDCPPICPDSYDPVCGTDGKKYENLCKLKLADCDDTETDIQRDPAGTCLENES